MERALTHQAPVREPGFIRTLYNDTRMGWFWLPFRLVAGYLWLEAASHKVFDPHWVGTGDALKEFWQKQLQLDPMKGIEVGWYRDFIQWLLNSGSYSWFGPVIAYSELAIGIALILGAFTGLAALGGALMNWNYVMAGTASLKGILLAIEVFLILTWKVAGWVGLDRRNTPDRIARTVPAHVQYWRTANLEAYEGGPFADHSGGLITFAAPAFSRQRTLSHTTRSSWTI